MTSQSIIHIVIDDKFVDNAIERFEFIRPGVSRYLLIGEQRPFRYIKSDKVEIVSLGEALQAVSSTRIKAVVFHSLVGSQASLVHAVQDRAAVAWLGWGYDYYETLLKDFYPSGLLLPETKRRTRRHKRPIWRRAVSRLRRSIKHRIYPQLAPSVVPLSRIDYFSPVLELEHTMAREKNPDLTARYLAWNYQSSNYRVDSEQLRPGGNSILVGNSAAATGNHFDILEILRRVPCLGDRTIVCPLNYGDMNYAESVATFGASLFGERFKPILDWMPLDEYLAILAGCDTAVMGHLRQQAAGNIHNVLRNGGRIFMSSRSPLFQSLTQRGARIFTVDQLERDPSLFNELVLDGLAVENNRIVVDANREYAPDFSRTASFLDALLNGR